MSIENLLTLGVAAGLLAVAAILRLLVVGGLKLVYLLLGREPQPQPADKNRAVRQRRPVARPALNGLGTLGRGVIVVLATLGTWLAAAGGTLARRAVAGYTSLSPRVAAGTKTGLTVGAGKIKTFAIVALASAQHLARAMAQLVRERAAARAARQAALAAPAEEPQEGRVIRLDREWDPLTDPLEDQPASNYR